MPTWSPDQHLSRLKDEALCRLGVGEWGWVGWGRGTALEELPSLLGLQVTTSRPTSAHRGSTG